MNKEELFKNLYDYHQKIHNNSPDIHVTDVIENILIKMNDLLIEVNTPVIMSLEKATIINSLAQSLDVLHKLEKYVR